MDGSYFVEGFPLGYVKEYQQLLLISQNISGYCMAAPTSCAHAKLESSGTLVIPHLKDTWRKARGFLSALPTSLSG